MSVPAPDPVAIIGASGALRFGLAVRLARAGVPVAIGSRDPDRAQEAAQRALAVIPDGSFSGHDNAQAPRAADTGIPSVPFRNHSETLTHPKDPPTPRKLLIDPPGPPPAA